MHGIFVALHNVLQCYMFGIRETSAKPQAIMIWNTHWLVHMVACFMDKYNILITENAPSLTEGVEAKTL